MTYVGQTVVDLNTRIQQHVSSPGCRRIHNAIRKYGIDAFDICVLDTAVTREELNAKEEAWIAFYQCVSPHGYNLTTGGQHPKMSRETIAIRKDQNDKYCLERYLKRSATMKARWKEIKKQRQEIFEHKQTDEERKAHKNKLCNQAVEEYYEIRGKKTGQKYFDPSRIVEVKRSDISW